ncbi:hypothetical protein [Actinocrispum sp. NPDC049592]|uniref:hypothetical protein n=1 Tax=Actinocrispum sp. NPDC049592 TaxID=3154835 RepID=UPI00344A4032
MRRSIALIAVTTVFVAGCSTGQGDPKVAATVGSTTASTVEQVQQRLNDVLSKNPQAQEVAKQHKLDLVARGIVTQDVLHVLAAAAAKSEGITVNESMLPALAPALTGPKATGGDPFLSLVDSAFPANDLTRDRLIMGELGRRSIGKTIVTIDGAVLTDADKARKLARGLAANPADFQKLVGELEIPEPITDQNIGAIPGEIPPEQMAQATSQILENAALPFMGAPEGTVVMWRLPDSQQGGYAVVYIKKRAAAPAGNGLDLSQADPAQLVAAGQTQLLADAWKAGVQPNQRYGAWDPVLLKVIPTEEAATGSMFLTANTGAKQQ